MRCAGWTGPRTRPKGGWTRALDALNRALIELGEAQAGVERALEALDFDPGELERVEERLFAIRALARKHGVLADDLGGFAEGLRARLAAIDGGAAGIAAAAEGGGRGRSGLCGRGRAGDGARRAAASGWMRRWPAELAPLKMERAVFVTEVAPGEPGPEGVDAVTFSVATNPGAPAGPLNRIASGGELSRFLLALKVCLTGESPGQTLIFDEIDRGVGGATADAVGRRLQALAAGRAGAGRDALAAGRGLRGAALAGGKAGRRTGRRCPRSLRWTRRTGSKRSPGCWRATR